MGITVAIIILAVVIFLLLAVTLAVRNSDPGGGKRASRKRNKDAATLMKEAKKKLASNPKDADALLTMADIHFEEGAWEKCFRTYEILIDLSPSHPQIPEFHVTLRHALAAMKLKRYEDAYKSMVVARTLQADQFDVNYNLGFLEYQRKNYEKAIQLLRAAETQEPEHIDTRRYLGQAYAKAKKYKDAINRLKSVVDAQPDDKASLFIMAQCFYDSGQNEKALRIFSHLRPDPKWGPQASLYAGTINVKLRRYEQAQLDFEIGLRHQQIPTDIMLELKYRLAAAYSRNQELDRALPLLHEIRNTNPNYKDVQAQIASASELHQNRNLQTYLIAPPSEFVTLCRKLTSSYFPQSQTKITDISVQKSEYTDILAEIETSKWMDVILFRFIRSTGQVGEFMLRDFHGRIKECKAGRGLCFTAGKFTEGAEAFVEARLIDLIPKDELLKRLRALSRR
ncbi:tetratricopeptide repeat protein [Spirochaeta africana]|uniref:Restriction endonuclease n=1 Tax=Spirochaeta africana (strain ATCC 700263 / DSM 8902 / Z-7692) TaxID=889378 RepID=H9UML7_SPIAZ|nr:tetratricopeptide repeat protein [Spirochaeta africana]AFG38760.1 Restriction endonuclease [Spirochaeta africana DSM 8902]